MLIENAPVGEHLFTNSDKVNNGNSYIRIEDLELDWNRERLGSGYTIPAGPTSSGLMLANTQFAWINRVFSKNGGLHCFDITSPEYNRTSGQNSPTYYQPKDAQIYGLIVVLLLEQVMITSLLISASIFILIIAIPPHLLEMYMKKVRLTAITLK